MIGGWDAFTAATTMAAERHRYPAFQIPVTVLRATVDNNMPGSEVSVGADTALNYLVEAVDRIRHTSAAARRCFVVETVGGYCGYLALMSGISGGAVRVYLHEEGVTLRQLADDVERMVDCFAPAIGNAHGQYTAAPVLDHQRVSDLVEATGVPMALHGGTGLSEEHFRDLIARGCAKVNISTALKEAFMKSGLEFLHGAEEAGKWDPPSLFRHQTAAVTQMAREHMQLFGSSGRP